MSGMLHRFGQRLLPEWYRQLLEDPPRPRDLFYLLPGALFALAGLLLFHAFWLQLPPKVRGFFDYYPFLVLVIGLLLGWRFNRTRLIFALLVLAVAESVLSAASGREWQPVAVAAVGLLLPANLVVFSFCSEKGLLGPAGVLRLLFITAQVLLVYLLYYANPEGLRWSLEFAWLDWPLFDPLQLPQNALYVSLVGTLVLLVRWALKPNVFEGGLAWALLLCIIPLALGQSGQALTLWFATAGLVLVVSLIETSHRMAFRDELTGLPSRRALNEELLKVGRCYTIAMVDVDHFKKVNDNHGHDVGDQVLKKVAAQLEEVTGGGRSFRYGGEEFTVLFPGKSVRDALPHLEDLRFAIEKSGFTLRSVDRRGEGSDGQAARGEHGGQRLRVTVSIGVAELNQFNQTSAEVIKAADKNLYRAKQEGRNQVCWPGKKKAD